MMTAMTELEAWEFLKESFQVAGDNPATISLSEVKATKTSGLCNAIGTLYSLEMISEQTWWRMTVRLRKHRPLNVYLYWWPTENRDGNLARARFCEERIVECLKGEPVE